MSFWSCLILWIFSSRKYLEIFLLAFLLLFILESELWTKANSNCFMWFSPSVIYSVLNFHLYCQNKVYLKDIRVISLVFLFFYFKKQQRFFKPLKRCSGWRICSSIIIDMDKQLSQTFIAFVVTARFYTFLCNFHLWKKWRKQKVDRVKNLSASIPLMTLLWFLS